MKSSHLIHDTSGSIRFRALSGNALEQLSHPRVAAGLLAILALWQLLYANGLPLFGDEAYYWTWSRDLAASYYDHPPMIAWLLRAATAFASIELTVRLVPVTCAALTGWLIHAIARDVFGARTAALALVLYLIMPATQLNALVATPDAPLLMFWTLALFAALRAIRDERTRDFALTGAALGLAMLSKYTAVLLGGALLAFIVLRRPRWLTLPGTWGAIVLALAVFSPVIVWNARHDWISFAFQYAHGTGASYTLDLGQWAEFLAGLAGIFSPPLFLLAGAACLSRPTWRDPRRTLLALATVLPLALFAWKGLFAKMELNWAGVIFPSATVLAAGFIVEGRRWRWLTASVLITLVLSALIKFPVAMGLPARLNITDRLFGPREAITALLPMRRPGEPLLADHYTTASLLSFYAPDHPPVRIPVHNRFSQYDLRDTTNTQPRGLFLSRRPDSGELVRTCGEAHQLQVFTATADGFAPKTFYFYRCGT